MAWPLPRARVKCIASSLPVSRGPEGARQAEDVGGVPASSMTEPLAPRDHNAEGERSHSGLLVQKGCSVRTVCRIGALPWEGAERKSAQSSLGTHSHSWRLHMEWQWALVRGT